MSYDFRLFKQRAGEDPYVTARSDSDGFPPTSLPDPQKEQLKRRVADALKALDPKLEVFKFQYEQIAKYRKISVEEARLEYRHLELNNSPEVSDNIGIQITLFDDEASVAVPFWHQGGKAEETFCKIWSYLDVIARETGYLIYDPQIDRVVDASAGIDDAIACYTGVVRQLKQKLPPGITGKGS